MVNLDDIDQRIREAERAMAARLYEDMFPPFIGPMDKPRPILLSTRLRWRWYGVREWIAVHVLRVDIHEDEGDEW